MRGFNHQKTKLPSAETKSGKCSSNDSNRS